MNIAINGLIIDKNKAGIGQYGYNLINALVKYSQFDYALLLQNDIEVNYDNIIYRNEYKKSINRIWDEQVIIPPKYKNYNLIHFLDYSSPIKKIEKPFIITIHDLCFYKYPDTFTSGSRNIKKIITPISIKNAQRIITVSENTKKDIIDYFPFAKDKIRVIYPGASKVKKIISEDKIEIVNSKYGISGKYILSVGTLEPRKNIKRLVEAYKIVNEYCKDIKLVIVGKKGWLYDDLFTSIGSDKLKDNIVITGYVDQVDMSELYSGAEVFVYPSIYEGFGLPPLEAMKCGTPVIVSNTSSLPEVVGDAGIFINPFDIDSIKDGILKVINDKDLRKELIDRGYKQASKFDWSKAAANIINVYREILE